MTNIQNLDEFLEGLQNNENCFVIQRELKDGDLIQKSNGLAYKVDNTEEILSLLGEYEDFPYNSIHRILQSNKNAVQELFRIEGVETGEQTVLPFTSVVRQNIGECLEKAILTHLSLQSFPFIEDKFLVSGNVSESDPYEIAYHAYNLAKKTSQWVLIDTENPYAIRENGVIVPYIIPVKGVVLGGMYPLELDPEIAKDRTYYLRI